MTDDCIDENYTLVGLNSKCCASYCIQFYKKCSLKYEYFYKYIFILLSGVQVRYWYIRCWRWHLTAKGGVYNFSVKYDEIIYKWVQKSQDTVSDLNYWYKYWRAKALKLKLHTIIPISLLVERNLKMILLLKENQQNLRMFYVYNWE